MLDEELDEEAIYVMHRTFDDSALVHDAKQLYVLGLKVGPVLQSYMRTALLPYGRTAVRRTCVRQGAGAPACAAQQQIWAAGAEPR